MNPERLARTIQATPFALRILVMAAVFGVAGYWCITDSGPYALFRSGPSRTATHLVFYWRAALLTIGVVLVPAAALLLVVGARFERKRVVPRARED